MPPIDPPPERPDVRVRRYWGRYVRDDGTWRIDSSNGAPLLAPGEELAALRSGLGRTAGTAPALWPFYTTPPDDGRFSIELEAEHAALALYGLHQQGRRDPVHKRDVRLGGALRALQRSDRFSADAVDRRVAALANASSASILVYRLRGLITQMRSIGQPLDYDALLKDIQRWHAPRPRNQARRELGLAYYAWAARPKDPADAP
jgi:CRISPR system Cascade subunit CasB